MGSHYLPNRMSCVSKTTMDCCLAIWHRVGGRQFIWLDVADLLNSPSQLRGMRNRGYLKEVGELPGQYRNYNPKIWQVTDQIFALVDSREETYA
jgi:hypothetical protein